MRIKYFFILLFCLGLILSSCKETVHERTVIRSLEDLDGKPVSVIMGTVQDKLISEQCPNSKVLWVDTDGDTFLMVENGKVCATIISAFTWRQVAATYSNIVDIGVKLKPMDIAFAFNKEHSELLEKFNSFLSPMVENGEVQELIEKWSDPGSSPQMPDPSITSGENGTLKIAVCAITVPFDYLLNGEIVGVEPEIAARFAASLGMKWEFTDMTFSGLIAYLQSGKAVMGSSIICVTPERQQSVNFSIPHFQDYSTVLVNKKYAPEELVVGDGAGAQSFWNKLKSNFLKSFVVEKRYMLLLEGLKSTVLISVFAALFGTLLGALLCFTLGRRNRIVSGISKLFVEFMRRMPQIVMLMIMYYIVFGSVDINGVWVAIISFSLCFAAYTSIIFRSAVDSIDKGQTEAALSMGFSRFETLTNIILPQTIQRALPVYRGEFIALVRATSIVGYIAIFDLTRAGDIIRSRTYEAFFPLVFITIVYFLVIWVLSIVLKYIEIKTQPKRKRFFK